MPQVMLEPATSLSKVEHSTTEPLSLLKKEVSVHYVNRLRHVCIIIVCPSYLLSTHSSGTGYWFIYVHGLRILQPVLIIHINLINTGTTLTMCISLSIDLLGLDLTFFLTFEAVRLSKNRIDRDPIDDQQVYG